MSSILEALKKAEQEDPVHGVSPDLKLGAHRLLATQPLSEPSKTTKIPVKLWAAAGGILFIILAVLLVLSIDRPEPELVPNTVKPDKPIRSNKIYQPVSPLPEDKPVPPPLPAESAKIPAPPPVPAKQLPPPEKIDGAEPQSVKPVANDIVQAVEPAIPPAAKPAPLPEKTENITEIPEMKEKIEPVPVEENIPALVDDSITIQAISWDSDPENRIAVINNRVLNENESIENYRIAEIRKDAVLFEKGGQQFMRKFNYR